MTDRGLTDDDDAEELHTMMGMTRRCVLAAAVLGLVAGAAGPARAGLSYTYALHFDADPLYSFDAADFSFDSPTILGVGGTATLNPTGDLNGFEVPGIRVSQLTTIRTTFVPSVPSGAAGVPAGDVATFLLYANGQVTAPGFYSANAARGISNGSGTTQYRYVGGSLTVTANTAAVPEPSSVALAGLMTLAGLGYAWRRRRAA